MATPSIAQQLNIPSLIAIVEDDFANYEDQLERLTRSLEASEQSLKSAVSVLSKKRTLLAVTEKQALRDGSESEAERSLKRLEMAVKFAEGEVDLQQRRVLRLTRKRDEAAKGKELNQQAIAALAVLTKDDVPK